MNYDIEHLRMNGELEHRFVQLVDAYYEGLESMKSYNKEAYKEGMKTLRDILDYWHFDDDMLEEASSNMKNEDGTIGFHFSKQNVIDGCNNLGYNSNELNLNDMVYVVNMLYSDYSPILGNDIHSYAKMAKLFIMDKDAPNGKALKYYYALH